jgi:tRNA pseudouridine32 synthase / 23S rRNA pseudouridine746 synthase
VSSSYQPPAGPVRILHFDTAIIVASKPPGLLSVPGRGAGKADCLQSRVAGLFPGARAVHRLDMETSGLMLFARSDEALRALGIAFAQRAVEKDYVASVWGRPDPAIREIDLPLIADWPNRPRQMVDRLAGKPSLTHMQVIAAGARTSRLRLRPVTGRSHQLRVHLAAIGHPVLGDTLYAHQVALQCAPRLHLHAVSLGFAHPETGAWLHFTDPATF